MAKGDHAQVVSPRERAGRNTSRIVCKGHHLRGVHYILLPCVELAQLAILHRASIVPLHAISAKGGLWILQARDIPVLDRVRLGQCLRFGRLIYIIQNRV